MRYPCLIAECCQNHLADRRILGEMIWQAAAHGADFVKIQALYSSDLTRRARFESQEPPGIFRPYQAELDRLSKLDLAAEDESWFVKECARAGVKSMITVFTRAAVKRLAATGFDAVKVASYDCASFPLLEDIRAAWRTVFVSTGATTDSDVAEASSILRGVDLHLLHCVTEYPTRVDAAHLSRIAWLRQFAPRVGWSDHSLTERDGLLLAKIALALGADVIERHYTVLDPDKTKDGPVSIGPSQLAELRAFADLSLEARSNQLRSLSHEVTAATGVPTRQITEMEVANRDYYAGRVASWVNGRPIFNWERRSAVEDVAAPENVHQ